MKQKKVVLLAASFIASAAVIGTAIGASQMTLVAEDNETTLWKHYAGVAATLDTRGVKEYWVSCNTHEHQFTAPTKGTIQEGAAYTQKAIDALPAGDDRVVERYGTVVDFEDGVVPSFISIKQSISKLEVTADGVGGSKCLKASITTSDWGIKWSKEYLDRAFADPNVVGIKFEAKGSFKTNNFRHRTAGSNVTYENGADDWGLEKDYWKTFCFTRAFYEAYADGDAPIYGGGAVNGDYLLVDNIRPVTKGAETYGFESGRMVKPTVGGYEHKVSWRAIGASTEMFIAQASNTIISSYEVSNEHATEGVNSLKITKETGYCAFTLGGMYAQLGANDRFAFDLYSTVAINGNVGNIKDGVNNNIAVIHPANQQCTYFMTKSQIESGGRFLIIMGSTAGDFYFDNFRIIKDGENANGFESDLLIKTSATEYSYDQGLGPNEALLRVNGYGSIEQIGLSKAVKSEGKQSLRIQKKSANEMAFFYGYNRKNALGEKKIYMDILSTVDLPAGKLVDGNRAYTNETLAGGFKAYEWKTIALDVNNLTSDGRMLILNGGLATTFFIDNVVVK